ncbi:MAG TPA: enoyl-ACP reductase [Bacillota bacterium]|nr:enoyl-ACP reductase [Bacillota bacterium]
MNGISLQKKTFLIMGVANQRSIAWAVARAYAAAGARLIFTYQDERFKSKVERLVEAEMPGSPLLPCNVSSDAEIERLVKEVEAYGVLHGLVHSIAYARKEELAGMYVHTSREGFRLAHDISAYSLTAVTRHLYPLMKEGGSIITLTFQGSQRAIPNYNVMGVAKASLEASVRYLARDLGPFGIRVNAISAGPVRTISAKGVAGFDRMLHHAREITPLQRPVEASEVAGAALFLASDLASAVTGTILYVDCGYHIMGA